MPRAFFTYAIKRLVRYTLPVKKSFWSGGGCRILSLLLTYGDKGRGQKSENLADIICASFLMVIGCYGSHEYNVALINSFKALKPFHLSKS